MKFRNPEKLITVYNYRTSKYNRLSDFSSEYVLETVARCINAIYQSNASKNGESKTLPFPRNPVAPSAMSARYQ